MHCAWQLLLSRLGRHEQLLLVCHRPHSSADKFECTSRCSIRKHCLRADSQPFQPCARIATANDCIGLHSSPSSLSTSPSFHQAKSYCHAHTTVISIVPDHVSTYGPYVPKPNTQDQCSQKPIRPRCQTTRVHVCRKVTALISLETSLPQYGESRGAGGCRRQGGHRAALPC